MSALHTIKKMITQWIVGKVYEAALANAKAVLDDKDATVEEIKEATEKLAKAAKDLVKKEENKKPETPSTDGSDESGKKPVTGDSAATPMMMVLAAAASVIAGKEILERKREKREVDRE